MAIGPGARIGSYEVIAILGEGGMGKVWRARHLGLKRDDALKLLPDAFVADPERLARFEREAQVLASLNHPNIAHVYGLEETGGARALVMELVEGETLADRVARGRIPVDESIAIARQIADALDAAHAHGIIHRDLKPANISLRPDGIVKVLDFGLAKVVEPAVVSSSVTMSPTITSPATMPGMILGTAAYMAPEQAQGGPVDKRTDMWAFGCVLYEMLTGRRPFAGHAPMDVIAQVLAGQPDWSALPPGLPDGAARVLRRCLEKNVQRRLRDAADARLDLEDRGGDAGQAVQGSRRTYWWVAALVAVSAMALAIGVATGRRVRNTAAAPVLRTSIVLPPGQSFQTGRRAVAISPDGQQIIYSLSDGLHIRQLDAFESRPIPGTANAINPAFSPDGRRVAVWTLQGLRNIDPLTGTTTALRSPTVDMGGILGSLSWDEYGLMVTQGASGVYLFPPDSTDGRRIIELAAGEAVSSAEMLPGGEHVLMTILSLSPGRPGSATGQVVVHALQNGSRTTVIESGSDARYLPSGHIVYAAGGALYAMEFDVETRRARGEPWAVVEGVRATNVINATTHYAVSDTGTLVYVPGQPMSPALALDLVQSDRKGGVRFLHLPAAPYETPRVSPDGRLVAVGTDDGKEGNIWIHDLSRPSSARKLTVGMGRHRFPVWSPDGRRIVFQSNREGDTALFSQAADGSDAPLRMTKAEAGAVHTPESWSPSGTDLLFAISKDGTNRLMRLSLASSRVEPFADLTSGSPTAAAFSPDGKWVAYNMRLDTALFGSVHATFVQPFPATGAIYPISSNDDGHHPVWSRDGRELFYVPGPGQLAVVTVTAGSSFTFSPPSILPPAGLMGPGTFNRNFDILQDASGFIGRQVAEDEESRLGAPPRIHVVTNWFEDLNRRRQAR
jgi:serine/threonine-protein kinase